ncbi:calcium-binding protein, partial [Aestuariispira insulae]
MRQVVCSSAQLPRVLFFNIDSGLRDDLLSSSACAGNVPDLPEPEGLKFLTPTGEYTSLAELSAPLSTQTAIPGYGVRRTGRRTTVYNFTVEGLHTYVAGGYRVHNDSIQYYRGVGSVLGGALFQELGERLFGDSVAVGIVSGALGRTLGGDVGQVIHDAVENTSTLDLAKAVDTFGVRFAGAVTSSAVSFGVSRVVDNVLGDTLGDGYLGGAISTAFKAAGSSLIMGGIGTVLKEAGVLTTEAGFGAFGLTKQLDTAGKEIFDAAGNNIYSYDPMSIGGAIAGAVGSYLGSRLAMSVFSGNPQSISIGSAVGSTVATIGVTAFAVNGGLVALGAGFAAGSTATFGAAAAALATNPAGWAVLAVAAFVGSFLGGGIGSLFGGGGGKPIGHANVDFNYSKGEYYVSGWGTDNGLDANVVIQLGEAASDLLNGTIGAVGGVVKRAPGGGGYGWSEHGYGSPAGTFSSAEQSIKRGVLKTLKSSALEIEGGDLYMKRALRRTNASTFDQLQTDLKAAAQFGLYNDNKALFNDFMDLQGPTMRKKWEAMLERSLELGLDKATATDTVARDAFDLQDALYGTDHDDDLYQAAEAAAMELGENQAKSDFLVFDLGGDGIELTDAEKSNVLFDIDQDGYLEKTAWIGANDGLLVRDWNDDGKINDISEIYTRLAPEDPNGAPEQNWLASEDSNHDGVFDAQDEDFDKVRIWRDTNQNGITEFGELHALHRLGITAIRLTGLQAAGELMKGNQITYSSRFAQLGIKDRFSAGVYGVSLKHDSLGLGFDDLDDDASFSMIDLEGRDNVLVAQGSENLSVEIDASASGIIIGGAGDDEMDGSKTGGEDGSQGVILNGEDGDDTLLGGSGKDRLTGGTGKDILKAGAGDDILAIDADDLKDGTDNIDAGEGQDIIVVDGDEGVTLDITAVNAEAAIGNAGDDILSVSADIDAVLIGKDGNDTLTGAGGDDQIDGGSGDDHLTGNAGDDRLKGGAGSDTFSAGAGDDILYVDAEDEIANIDAGVGMDIVVAEGSGSVNLDASAMNAEIVVGGAGNDILFTSGETSVELHGGAGDDTLSGSNAADTFVGGAGLDSVSYADADSAVSVNLTDKSVSGAAAGDVLMGIEGVIGTDYDDQLAGDDQANILRGGKGADQLDGGAGDDILEGGAGADTLKGGEGSDTVSYEGSNRGVVIDLSTDPVSASGGDAAGDVFESIENAIGSRHADRLIGDANANTLAGGAGRDTLIGGGGADRYVFNLGDGADTVIHTGDDGAVQLGDGITAENVAFVRVGNDLVAQLISRADSVTVKGWFTNAENRPKFLLNDGSELAVEMAVKGGADGETLTASNAGGTLLGLAGNDTLKGGDGKDVMSGGAGSDLLEGDAGDDVYHFARGDGSDVINDHYRYREAYTYTTQERGRWITQFNGENSNPTTRWVKGGGEDTFVRTFHHTGYHDRHGDGGDDVLAFGPGISADDLVMTIEGNDLVIGILGDDRDQAFADLTDKIRLKNWLDEKDRIERFTFSDGDTASLDVPKIVTRIGTDGADVFTMKNIALTAGLGDGDDIVTGSNKGDVISGDDGNDVIDGAEGDDALSGDQGDDTISGGKGGDYLFGGDGKDTLSGGEDADLLRGDDGDDHLLGGEGQDKLVGGKGADLLDGGEGLDTASYEDSETGVTVDLSTGTGSGGQAEGDQFVSIENLEGSAHDDILTGDDKANIIRGGKGQNELHGGAGEDLLIGDVDDDLLVGGADDDVMIGGTGANTYLFGKGSGHDIIRDEGEGSKVILGAGISGEDIQFSRVGDDLVAVISMKDRLTVRNWFVKPVHQVDFFDASGNEITVTFLGDHRNNLLVGDSESNILEGLDGDDVLDGGAGADTLDGGTGADTAYYGNSNAAVTVDLSGDTPSVSGGDAEGDHLISIENVTGSDHADTLTGSDGDNSLTGGKGADKLDGGAGIDTAIYSASAHGVTVSLATGQGSGGEAEGDTLTSIENILGSAYADTLVGSDGDNLMHGDFGADSLMGGAGNDQMMGGWGHDRIHGGTGDDTLSGDVGNDLLLGGDGNDVIRGGLGNDTVSYADDTKGVSVNLAAGRSTNDAVGDDFFATEVRPRQVAYTYTKTIVRTVPSGEQGTRRITERKQATGYRTVYDIIPTDFDGNQDSLESVENVTGSRYADRIQGDGAANIIEGGLGDDTLDGGAGNDVYVFSRGDGRDQIHDLHEVTEIRQRQESERRTRRVEYVNGEGVTRYRTEEYTHTWNVDYDVQVELDGGQDILKFGAGIIASDLVLQRDGNDMLIGLRDPENPMAAVSDLGDVIRVKDWADSKKRIEKIRFADDTEIDISGIENAVSADGENTSIEGSSGADWLIGGASDDTLYGKGGNDILIGNGGQDTAVLEGNLRDYEIEHLENDTVRLTHKGTGEVVVLQAVEQVNFADASIYVDGRNNDPVLSLDLLAQQQQPSLLILPGTSVTGALDVYDVDGDTLSVALAGTVENGTFEILDGVNYKYTPDAGFKGVEIVTLEITDGKGGKSTGYFRIGVGVLRGTVNDDSLTGLSGDEVLYGLEGNDHLKGLAGNDTLHGSNGADVLDGGSGEDLASYENSSEGVTVDLVSGTGANGTAGGDQLVSIEHVKGSNQSDTLTGNDGDNSLTGLSGEDVLVGGAGADDLIGGAGNDTLMGGLGDDVYVFGRDSGKDLVIDHHEATEARQRQRSEQRTRQVQYTNGEGITQTRTEHYTHHWTEHYNVQVIKDGGNDVLRFETGIGVDDLVVTRIGDDLVVGLGVAGGTRDLQEIGDQITLQNWFGDSKDRIESFLFADGQEIGVAGIVGLLGTDQDDNLSWTETAATLHGGLGDDTLSSGDADDVITGDDGNDRLTSGAGDDTQDGGSGNDFLDGGAGNDTLNGGTGDDTLLGGSGNDSLSGGAGNDILTGGTGSDSFVFGAGSGLDTIEDAETIDQIVLTGGLSASGVTFVKRDDSLVLILSDDDQLTIKGWFSGTELPILLEDGTALTVQVAIAGTEIGETVAGTDNNDIINALGGDDTVIGGIGNDTLNGGQGNDRLEGGIGDDVYLFGRGGGKDVVVDHHEVTEARQRQRSEQRTRQVQYTNGEGVTRTRTEHYTHHWTEHYTVLVEQDAGQDILRFEAGIMASDLVVTRIGDDLVVGLSGDTQSRNLADLEDQITLTDWFTDSKNRIERFEFADGTVQDVAQITAQMGSSGDDTLTWTDTAVTLRGGEGNDNLTSGAFADRLEGGEGNDTLSAGAGDDILDGGTGDDVLDGGAGNDVLEGSDGADQLTGGAGEDTLSGGAGDDILTGGQGNDTLDGGIGNDTLVGGEGSDVFLLTAEAGLDVIEDADGSDRIVLADGISAEQVVFLKNDNDLTLILTEESQLLIRNWFTGSRPSIETSDGTSVPVTVVIQGSAEGEILAGSDMNDFMVGFAGHDTLIGGAGNDTLSGGAGSDLLQGQDGDDIYMFGRGYGADSVLDHHEVTEARQRQRSEQRTRQVQYTNGEGVTRTRTEHYTHHWTEHYTVQVEQDAGQDILRFEAGITASDLVVTRIGDDLVVGIAGPDGSRDLSAIA